jgi:hypothetical protein
MTSIQVCSALSDNASVRIQQAARTASRRHSGRLCRPTASKLAMPSNYNDREKFDSYENHRALAPTDPFTPFGISAGPSTARPRRCVAGGAANHGLYLQGQRPPVLSRKSRRVGGAATNSQSALLRDVSHPALMACRDRRRRHHRRPDHPHPPRRRCRCCRTDLRRSRACGPG